MARIPIALLVALTMLLFVHGSVPATAEAPAPPFVAGTTSENWSSSVNEQDFDLQGCEEDCRRRFGYELYRGRGPRGGLTPGYWLYARCIQRCNRVHWDVFDREMKELEKE